ncbi:MAG: 3-hexulose-6-phosphate synthase [Methanoculleaceae archaeon]
MTGPVLQVALDLVDLPRAIQIAREAVDGGADWIEAGTPLIKSEGMNSVRALRDEFPSHTLVADMKVADTGAVEVEMAAKAGADIVTILASADDAVIREAIRAARKYGVRIMADLINTPDPEERGRVLAELGVDIIIAHTGIDRQMEGGEPLELLSRLSGSLTVPLAIAGGLDAATAARAAEAGASIIIVGSAITKSADVSGTARSVREAIRSPHILQEKREDRETAIRRMLESVSTPNVSDAMHRKGAMKGLFPVKPGLLAVGRAVTVQTFSGDWAKPVEAIDLARPGDILVINNDGGVHVAPWGELATISCINRGIAGVVIDGAVRDIDDIRALNLPVYARAIVPNAGEPKGMGEINVEIQCGGQTVSPGDWIKCDDCGVVVIPADRAYEIARRAVEVKRTEDRIREEIRRGSTLSEVVELLRWEKRR